jgi:hypothetical protein
MKGGKKEVVGSLSPPPPPWEKREGRRSWEFSLLSTGNYRDFHREHGKYKQINSRTDK